MAQAKSAVDNLLTFLKEKETESGIDLEKIATALMVSYYNCGAEHEFLKEYEDAAKCYKEGVKISQKWKMSSSFIATEIHRSLQDVNLILVPLSWVTNRKKARKQKEISISQGFLQQVQ